MTSGEREWPCPRCHSRRHHVGNCRLVGEMEWREGTLLYTNVLGDVTNTFPNTRWCWEWARGHLESRAGSFLLEGERLWTLAVDAGGHSLSEAETVLASWRHRCGKVMGQARASELHVLSGEEHWRPNRVL